MTGRRTTLSCRPLQSGNVRISMMEGTNEIGSIELAPTALSGVVRDILLAAIRAHQLSGRPHPNRIEETSEYPYLRASSMGLGPCPEPDYDSCLVLHFGEAQIGMALSMSEARQLGDCPGHC
jgi:hypothetical protein